MEHIINRTIAIVEITGDFPDVARLLDHFAWVDDLYVIEVHVVQQLKVLKLIQGRYESGIKVLHTEVHQDLVSVGSHYA